MNVLIKRYANRKLYNTHTSRYITLKGIAELIEAGDEIRVIDNETGEDITSVALSQILVDNERTSQRLPGSVLTELIQRGGDVLYNVLRKRVLKLLDLPSRSDIRALDGKLERVAIALEKLDLPRDNDPALDERAVPR